MAFYTKLDHVADILRERILIGQYERGVKLKQADIAAELGVSVTPVREALKALEMEGYVASQPHKGLCVTEVDYDQFREILDLRIMLELDLTRRAIAKMTPLAFEILMNAQSEFARNAEKGDVIAARASNVRFHFKLYELAERPQSLQFARLLWAKYPFNYNEQQEKRLHNISHEHDEFLKHVHDRDVEAALTAMKAHIEAGAKRVKKLLAK